MPTEEHAVIKCRDFDNHSWGEITLFVTRLARGQYRLDNITCMDPPTWHRQNIGRTFYADRNLRTQGYSGGAYWPTWEVVIQHHLWVYENKREVSRA